MNANVNDRADAATANLEADSGFTKEKALRVAKLAGIGAVSAAIAGSLTYLLVRRYLTARAPAEAAVEAAPAAEPTVIEIVVGS